MSSNKPPRFRIALSYTEKYPDGFYWPEEEKSFLWFKYWSKFDINSNVSVQAMIDFDDLGKRNFVGTKEFAIKLIKIRKQIAKEAAERTAKLAHRKQFNAHRTQYINY